MLAGITPHNVSSKLKKYNNCNIYIPINNSVREYFEIYLRKFKRRIQVSISKTDESLLRNLFINNVMLPFRFRNSCMNKLRLVSLKNMLQFALFRVWTLRYFSIVFHTFLEHIHRNT